jgi:hypothetical protein
MTMKDKKVSIRAKNAAALWDEIFEDALDPDDYQAGLRIMQLYSSTPSASLMGIYVSPGVDSGDSAIHVAEASNGEAKSLLIACVSQEGTALIALRDALNEVLDCAEGRKLARATQETE